MDKQIIPLSYLSTNKKARIYDITGGNGFQRKLNTMGIRRNQFVKMMSKQPFKGPITVETCGCLITMGQGMAQKIIVEVK